MTAPSFGEWCSVLFLPASNPRAIDKARGLGCDLVILDLEDAVRPEDKEGARAAAVAGTATPWPGPVAIRVNGLGTPWHEGDVAAVAGSNADFVVLPRVETAAQLRGLAGASGKPALAMVETAAGVITAPDIARASAGLIAGTNDLRAELSIPTEGDRGPISMALQWIVLAAKAAGVPAIDGVYNRLDDDEGFAAEARDGRRLGFAGKSLIHPRQVAPCHAAFAPSAAEVARAERLLAAATGGAERFEGAMIERMHVEAARRTLQRAGAPQGLANHP